MSVASSSYSVSKPVGTCAASGVVIAPGERYVATLVQRDLGETLERLDFSHSAWERGERPMPPLSLFASWAAVMPTGESKKKLLLSDDEVLDLFEQLGEANTSKQLAFRFILALLLVRRRVLVLEGNKPGFLCVKVKRPAAEMANEPVIDVVDPGMDDAAIADAIEQMTGLVPIE
ncbi:MAG: hypothetical protein SFY96_14365 [Planctomycetota bacterium]|nr:hypothetical protein [Planctomycetota bacterium]